MMSEKWLIDKIEYLKGLEKPSITQRTLLDLYAIPENQRTSTNNKHLATLINVERTADKAASAQRAARKMLTEEREKKRKARTKHLIQLGALFEIANLDHRDPAELLGVLLKTAEIDPNDMKWQIWKNLGQETLNSKRKS